jgi:hypothetical protein
LEVFSWDNDGEISVNRGFKYGFNGKIIEVIGGSVVVILMLIGDVMG